MKIQHAGEFAAAPDSVFAVIADVTFQEAKVTQAGEGGAASVSADGDQTVIETTRNLPTDELPDVAKSFVGSILTLRETQRWSAVAADGSRTGSIEVTVDGAPVAMKGALALVPSGSGCALTLDADLKASVPLVGGRIEKAAAPAIVSGVENEQQLIRDRL